MVDIINNKCNEWKDIKPIEYSIKFDFEIPDFRRKPKRPEDKLPKKFRKGWK